MIANNFSLDDATKKATYQANIDHFKAIQDLSDEKNQSQNQELSDQLKLTKEEATRKL